MAETIDELTVNYEEDGVQVVEELDKEVLTRGAWTTIMFKFRQLDRRSGEMGKIQFSVRRYRKMHGMFKPQSKFTISSEDQARKVIEVLGRWVAEE
jgi:hypothetical protein